jgi:chaperonin GroEL
MDDPDPQAGINIVRMALEAPMRKLAANAGLDGAVIIDHVRHKQTEGIKNRNVGFDVIGDEYVDMLKVGIIDPVRVTRGALQNAASIAAMILTTEALITDVPTKAGSMGMPDSMGSMDF